ncbi:hypothetical protein BC833DRAFT_580547 [Globomyces pollinis-pini]|nr:hypothetical protein BC833DRAFT_580547 [Globomyces pollinis-pini]
MFGYLPSVAIQSVMLVSDSNSNFISTSTLRTIMHYCKHVSRISFGKALDDAEALPLNNSTTDDKLLKRSKSLRHQFFQAFEQLQDLKELYFNDFNFSYNLTDSFHQYLRTNQTIESIEFNGTIFQDSNLIFESLKNHQKIQNITFNQCQFDRNFDFMAFLSISSTLSSLKSVTIIQNFTTVQYYKIFSTLLKSKNVESLSIRLKNNELPNLYSVLTSFMKQNTSLKSLTILSYEFQELQLYGIFDALQVQNTVTHFQFVDEHLRDESKANLQSFLELQEDGQCTLQSLSGTYYSNR